MHLPVSDPTAANARPYALGSRYLTGHSLELNYIIHVIVIIIIKCHSEYI